MTPVEAAELIGQLLCAGVAVGLVLSLLSSSVRG